MFTAALFTIARTWNQHTCPLPDEWMKKEWYIYTREYYSAIKRNTFESVPMRQMNLEPIIQSEESQKEKEKYHILTHIYVTHIYGTKNLFAGQQWRNRQNRLMDMGRRQERVRWMERVTWNLTLPYAK